jgi:hypothetical protein
MNRRTLLKAAVAAGLSLAAVSLAPQGVRTPARVVEAAALGRLLRGASVGRVLESVDRGATWQVVANLGPHCEILRISERGGRAHLRAMVDGYAFDLHSTDARTWRTPEALESPA